LTRSFFTNYDATKVASIYNAIYYFSEYLLQCGNIDQSQASAIQQVCIKGFGKAYPNLEKQDVFALAFKNFPEWG